MFFFFYFICVDRKIRNQLLWNALSDFPDFCFFFFYLPGVFKPEFCFLSEKVETKSSLFLLLLLQNFFLGFKFLLLSVEGEFWKNKQSRPTISREYLASRQRSVKKIDLVWVLGFPQVTDLKGMNHRHLCASFFSLSLMLRKGPKRLYWPHTKWDICIPLSLYALGILFVYPRSNKVSKLNSVIGINFSAAGALHLLGFVQQPYETCAHDRTESIQRAHIVLGNKPRSFWSLLLIASEG